MKKQQILLNKHIKLSALRAQKMPIKAKIWRLGELNRRDKPMSPKARTSKAKDKCQLSIFGKSTCNQFFAFGQFIPLK
jgi:hypothetical protein